jgi:membrane protein implicated in regulation of membrane protease activity
MNAQATPPSHLPPYSRGQVPPVDGKAHVDVDGNPATQAVHEIPRLIKELKAYGSYLSSAKIDGAKAKARQIAIYAALGVLGLLVAAGILFTASFLLLSGLAMGLGALLWHQYWLGNVIVALLVLGGTAAGVVIGIRKFTGASRSQTEKKYEQKRIQQRAEFGHDVKQRAGRV